MTNNFSHLIDKHFLETIIIPRQTPSAVSHEFLWKRQLEWFPVQCNAIQGLSLWLRLKFRAVVYYTRSNKEEVEAESCEKCWWKLCETPRERESEEEDHVIIALSTPRACYNMLVEVLTLYSWAINLESLEREFPLESCSSSSSASASTSCHVMCVRASVCES